MQPLSSMDVAASGMLANYAWKAGSRKSEKKAKSAYPAPQFRLCWLDRSVF